MDKILYKFIKKMLNPVFVLLMFASIFLMALVPFFRDVVNGTFLLAYSLIVLFPLVAYLSMTGVLLIRTLVVIMNKIPQIESYNSKEFTVKTLARHLSISPIQALVFLECAERSSCVIRDGKVYRLVTDDTN